MSEATASAETDEKIQDDLALEIGNSGSQTHRWPGLNLCTCWYYLFWLLTRLGCFVCLVALCWQLFIQYRAKNPTTVTIYTDHQLEPSLVKVKICNNVFLDPDKILNYTGHDLSMEAYEFLYEAVKGNTEFDDSNWVLTDHLKPFFAISSRVKTTFLMDLDQFVIACFVREVYKDCSKMFFYFDESHIPCFEAWMNLQGYGMHYAATIYLYFDPNKTFGRYTKSIGSFVVISHPEQHITHLEGSFLAPGDLLTLRGSLVFKTQSESFSKSKCMHRKGTETYDFTGEPFETNYNVHSCGELCFAKRYYEICGCPPIAGWNLTKTECLEKQTFRNCIIDPKNFISSVGIIERCKADKCRNPCNEKRIRVKSGRRALTFRKGAVTSLLREITSKAPNASEQVARLLHQINGSYTAERDVAENMAQLSFFLLESPVTNLEIVEMVSFPTFIGNMGGVIGMWVGLSIISVIQLVEKILKTISTNRKCLGHSSVSDITQIHPSK